MRTATHRDLIVLDAIVRSEPKTVLGRPLKDLVMRIKKLFDAGNTSYWRNRKQRKIYLRRLWIAPDQSLAVLLIKCTTAGLPDEALADLETDQERLIEKDEKEGVQESVHLVLALENEPSQQHRYHGILESGHVLTRGMVEAYLNRLFKKAAMDDRRSFSAPKPSGEMDAKGKAKTFPYHAVLELQGHLSDSFKDDLDSGRLTGIDLVKALPDGGGPAEGRYVRAARQVLRLKSQSSWKENPHESLREAAGFARTQKLDKLRVTFNSLDKMPHSVEIDPDTENVIGDAFVKRCRIGPLQELKSLSCSEIDEEIVRAMMGLMRSHRIELVSKAAEQDLFSKKLVDAVLVSTS